MFLQRLYSPVIGIAIAANAIGTIVIFLLIGVMNFDVIARGIFHAPLRGVVEMVIFSLVLIVFLQLPDVARNNRLTRSDGFLILAQDRFPRAGDAMRRVIDLASCIFMGLITWTMWPEFIESIETCRFLTAPEFGPPKTGNLFEDIKVAFARCEYFGTPGIFTAPWWPAKMAIVFGTGLCSIIFAIKFFLGSADPALTHQGEDDQ